MTWTALVIDREALDELDSAIISTDWFKDFDLPDDIKKLRRIEIKDVIYLLSEKANADSKLLVIKLGLEGALEGADRPALAFQRIVRVALRHFDRSVALPLQWAAYHEGSLLSVYAESRERGRKRRIYFDQAPNGHPNLYAYSTSSTPQLLQDVIPDLVAYNLAIDNYTDAATSETPENESVGSFGILLSQPLDFKIIGVGSLAEWYDQRLSAEQIRFVDQVTDRPIRLRGAAGTGKTQAMAIKCLRDLYSDAGKSGDKTFGFLTHSSALAHDVLTSMFYALDTSARWRDLRTPTGTPKLWIGTLYDLAQHHLSYSRKGLLALSSDGLEGRSYQRILINDAIDAVLRDPRIALTLLKESNGFSESLRDPGDRQNLVEELMTEFACILDADNIKKGTREAESYVKAAREPWQMVLPFVADRKIALEIHDKYRGLLKAEGLLSMDQMIADFGRYLTTHEWNQLRERDGFDTLYVDEYHYFNRTEAMELHSLFKTRASTSGRWPLIMAYDLKQSTNDVALGGGIERFRNPGIGQSVAVDFKQIYRSTPEITNFLHDLDGAFPAMDLEGEYGSYSGISEVSSGAKPSVLEFEDNTHLVDEVFRLAGARGRETNGGGSQVAVLCLNEILFETYINASRLDGKFVSIVSREDLRDLRYARTKCVFSVPEYVAGLQFDTVYIIHADEADYDELALSQGAKRRYISRLYLGASRAVRHLYFATSKERGGTSQLLTRSVVNKTIRQR